MEKKKIDSYQEGYSRGDVIKRIAAGAAALLLRGGLTACGGSEKDIDGNMSVQVESDSFLSWEEDHGLMGEEGYYPDPDETESQSAPESAGDEATESVIYGQDQD